MYSLSSLLPLATSASYTYDRYTLALRPLDYTRSTTYYSSVWRSGYVTYITRPLWEYVQPCGHRQSDIIRRKMTNLVYFV